MCATLLKVVIYLDTKLDIAQMYSIIQQVVVLLDGQDAVEPGEQSNHLANFVNF